MSATQHGPIPNILLKSKNLPPPLPSYSDHICARAVNLIEKLLPAQLEEGEEGGGGRGGEGVESSQTAEDKNDTYWILHFKSPFLGIIFAKQSTILSYDTKSSIVEPEPVKPKFRAGHATILPRIEGG